ADEAVVLGAFLPGEMGDQLGVVIQDALARRQHRIAQRRLVTRQARRIQVLERLQGKIFLAGKVVIERALWDCRGLDYFLHAGAVVTAAGHDLRPSGEDQITLVYSGLVAHVGEDMTGRLVRPASSTALITSQPSRR